MFTWHFKREWERIGKPEEFVLEILNEGEHVRIAKRGSKWNVLYPYRGGSLRLSYAEYDDVILIHIKPVRRRAP